MQQIDVKASDGYEVPLEFFSAEQPGAKLLILPALGVQARLYRRLGAVLAESGISTVAMEQRGHGRSSLRPSRSCDYGFREWLEVDIPAALGWLNRQPGRVPVFLAGHSLGGHLSLMYRALNPDSLAGLVLLTTSTPWYECFHGRERLLLQFLIKGMPGLTALLGYYPGDKIGFGGRESRRLMSDWLVMARFNRYEARGIDVDIESAVQAGACPLLSIYCDRDKLAPLHGIEAVTRRLPEYEIHWFEITSDALGARADHISWSRQPTIAAETIGRWITAQLSN